MLILHLHFGGDCADAIALYEKAFNTKAENYDYRDNKIAHARMKIHGQTVWLNDNDGIDGTAHLVLTFDTQEELLACYDVLKMDVHNPAPFHETPYSKMVGGFLDKFGVLWSFILAEPGFV